MKHVRKLCHTRLLLPFLVITVGVLLFWRFAHALTPGSGQSTSSPQLIPFQGRLTNQAGTTYDNGQFTVTFNLYGLAVGGSTVWTERHEKVSVINGMINVFLGSINPITAVDFTTAKYLGITIDADSNPSTADPEMVPRTMILPAFFAKNSENLAGHNWSSFMTSNNPSTAFIQSVRIDANTINTSQIVNAAVTQDKLGTGAVTTAKLTDGAVTNAKLATNSVATANIQNGAITAAKLSTDVTTPAGTIVAYIGDTAPVGWYLCNGIDLPRGGVNANLEAVVGTRFGTAAAPATHFKLPDLRGYFLRGVDGGTGRDPEAGGRTPMAGGGAIGNAIGTVQGDAFQGHWHDIQSGNSVGGGSRAIAATADVDNRNVSDTGGVVEQTFAYSATTLKANTTHGAPRTSSETRPKNAYVNYIIKY